MKDNLEEKATLEIPHHLSYWQSDVDAETMRRWSNNAQDAVWKADLRLHVKTQGHKSILDCGAALCDEYFAFCREQYDVEYTATEITKKYVDHAKELGINIFHCGIDKLPFADKSFDYVMCYGVLNHQLEYEQAIREMVRVAKKEVMISFFKKFEENMTPACTSGKYELEKVETGTIEKRIIKDEKNVCLYNFFNKARMEKFINTCFNNEIEYSFGEKPDGTVILAIRRLEWKPSFSPVEKEG